MHVSALTAIVSLLALAAVVGMAFTGYAADYESFRSPGGPQKSIDGGIIASAATIAPAGYQTRVSGTTAIDTVQLPYDGFEGTIVLIPTAVWTLSTSGNVAIAVTAVVNKALHLTYSQRTAKWHPSYLS